jgi:hypothetical protein
LVDVIKENLLITSKAHNIETIKNYIREGDKALDDLWNKNHVVICTVDNYHTVLQFMQRAVEHKKPMIAIDCPELEVTVRSLLDVKMIDKLHDKYKNIISEKLKETRVMHDCELIRYPYHPFQCLDWAKNIFEEIISNNYSRLASFMENPNNFLNAFETSQDLSSFQSLMTLELLRILYMQKYPTNFEDCIELSVRIFDVDLFNI